jgi:hypothetical protein
MTEKLSKLDIMWKEDAEYLIKRALEEEVSVEWYVHHMIDRLVNKTEKLGEDIDWLREKTERPDIYYEKIVKLQHALFVETEGREGIMMSDNPMHKKV